MKDPWGEELNIRDFIWKRYGCHGIDMIKAQDTPYRSRTHRKVTIHLRKLAKIIQIKVLYFNITLAFKIWSSETV